jgi:hypothetical protein
MSSFKQLSKADVTTVPYTANKQWVFNFDASVSGSTYNEYYQVFRGTNITGLFNPLEPSYNNQYERLIYDTINHMFYQSYDGSLLNTGSLMFDVTTYESASQQRPTSSYFNYNTNYLLIKNFPTGSGAEITVLIVNQDTYGSKILPNSFKIVDTPVSPSLKIIDDGFGNIFDVAQYEDDYVLSEWVLANYFNDTTPGNGPIFVGHIFYAHGIVVITNPNYQSLFIKSYLLTEDSELIITEDSNNIEIE